MSQPYSLYNSVKHQLKTKLLYNVDSELLLRFDVRIWSTFGRPFVYRIEVPQNTHLTDFMPGWNIGYIAAPYDLFKKHGGYKFEFVENQIHGPYDEERKTWFHESDGDEFINGYPEGVYVSSSYTTDIDNIRLYVTVSL